MAWGLMAIGLGLKVLGDMNDNVAEARASLESAKWLQEQASHFYAVTERNKDILKRETKQLKGYRAAATAGNGVLLTGSYLDMDVQIDILEGMELAAIEQQGQMQIRGAQLKAAGLRSKATKLNSFDHNLTQSMGTIAGSVGTSSIISGMGDLDFDFGSLDNPNYDFRS